MQYTSCPAPGGRLAKFKTSARLTHTLLGAPMTKHKRSPLSAANATLGGGSSCGVGLYSDDAGPSVGEYGKAPSRGERAEAT